MANARGKTVHGKPPVVVGAACLALLALPAGTRGPSLSAPHPRGAGLGRSPASAAPATPRPRRLLSRRADAGPTGARRGMAMPSASPLLRTVHLGAFPQSFLVDDVARCVVVLQAIKQGGEPGDHLVLTVLDARSLAVVGTIPLASVSYQGDPGNAGGGSYAVDEAAGRVVSSQTSTGPQPLTRVSILDARSGAVLHTRDDVCLGGQFALDTAAGRIACLSIGRLGESASDIGVDVLDTRSGRLLHRYEIGQLEGAGARLAVDARHGRALVVLAVGSYSGGITVVDLRSGRGSDSTVNLGQGPPDIVVDQATGRTFVANEGDKTVSVLDTARLP